jgi:hypothetical protein
LGPGARPDDSIAVRLIFAAKAQPAHLAGADAPSDWADPSAIHNPYQPNSREPKMKYAQIFQYKLTLSREQYDTQWVKPYATAISNVPGLISKTWMADFDNGLFASFYIWNDKESMDSFMASPAIAQVAAEPFLKDLVITAIPIHEEASSITRGI